MNTCNIVNYGGLIRARPASTSDSGREVVVLKDKDLPSVEQEFQALAKLSPENRLTVRSGRNNSILRDFRWVNDIAYTDDARRDHVLSVLECVETSPGDAGVLVTKTFKWVTDLRVTSKTVQPIAGDGGRLRWKIENEGFNVQKNGGFALEQAYSQNAPISPRGYRPARFAAPCALLSRSGAFARRRCRHPVPLDAPPGASYQGVTSHASRGAP